MRWLICSCALLLACGEQAPPRVEGGSGRPPVGSVPNPGGGGSGGAGGQGGELGSRGACDNAADLGAIESAGGSLRDVARICGLPNNMASFCASLVFNGPRYEECISDCVEAQVDGISGECASCYGALERCGVEQIPSCRVPCQQNLCSTLCLDCLYAGGCIETYETCRGLPGDSCPI